MKKDLEQTYNNIYPFYESARQARIERKELNKRRKSENNLKRDKIRKDCLERATVTEGAELERILSKLHRAKQVFIYSNIKTNTKEYVENALNSIRNPNDSAIVKKVKYWHYQKK